MLQIDPTFKKIIHPSPLIYHNSNLKVRGFVNSLAISPSGGWIVAGAGQEHRLGRWWSGKSAKNKLVLIKVPDLGDDNNDADDDNVSYTS